MPTPTNFVYLDDDHLEDALFTQSLARLMHRRPALPPLVFVHGSGGEVERRLEADGLFPPTQAGLVQPQTPQDARHVEAGLLAATRKVVGTLVDEIIYAVGFQGTDRGLLQVDADGEVTIGSTGWLQALIAQGAVPVLAAVAHTPEGSVRQIPTHDALLGLAQELTDETQGARLVFLTKTDRPGLIDEAGRLRATAPAADVPDAVLPHPAAFRAAVASGHPVLLTSTVGLFGGDDLQATLIQP